MNRMGIGTWFNFKKMSPPSAITLVFIASVVLVVVSYGVWQFGRLLSPSGTFNLANPVVALSVSDYDINFVGLPNNTTDTTLPNFDSQTDPTILTFDGAGKLNMARLEIQLDYR